MVGEKKKKNERKMSFFHSSHGKKTNCSNFIKTMCVVVHLDLLSYFVNVSFDTNTNVIRIVLNCFRMKLIGNVTDSALAPYKTCDEIGHVCEGERKNCVTA